ncbi:hypothetical protein XELAEV_18024786mg [Xenopus laevis]|uniref:ADP-ribosylation factor-like protein 2-binding protein n=1 Tax=Xenopus laevis TaxID=8355 RepID=A0A974CZI9_XENLA|nr:hypothetical protein XELAEV_18024786mg [Xenopus laevis]
MEDLEDVNFTLSVYVSNTEENKLTYTTIFNDYIGLVEKYIEEQLLQCHCEEIAGDIFDKLLTFTDFLAFKEMFLDYKAEKEGRTVDLSCGLVVTPLISSSVSSSYYSCCYSFIVLSTFCTYFSM